MMRGQCYDGGHACAALAITLPTGELWVLPWHRFLHAHLAAEVLVLTFAEHRVEIRGRNLSVMFGQYVAEMKLSSIRELPAEYAAAVESNGAFIVGIEVHAME